MKIAFASDDGSTISAHLGRALFYVLITLQDGKEIARRLIPKEDFHHAHQHTEQHAAGDREHRGLGPEAEEKHRRMFEPVRDCELLVTRGMGYGAQRGLQQLGIQAILTDIRSVDEALQAYQSGKLLHRPERVH